jgi:hypothetical protein
MLFLQAFLTLWNKFKARLEGNSISEPIDYGGDPTDIYLA